MATPGTASPLGKKDRREAARETARLEREAEKRRERRNKIFLQGGIGVAVIAIAAVIVLVVTGMNGAPAGTASKVSPKNMASDGILFTGGGNAITATTTAAVSVNKVPAVTATDAPTDSGVAHIVTYVDWACPACKSFEASYSSGIASLVTSGKATLEVHPISILDANYPGSRFASRAANVAACVANFEPSKFLDVQTVFYSNQPAEGSSGLTNSAMKTLVKNAGAENAQVTKCIDDETYSSWVSKATARTTSNAALVDPSSGKFATPTAFVNGKRWNNSADFMAFITTSTK